MLLVDYPPGAIEHIHRHDANAFVYVLEGEIVMGVRGGKEVHLKPGETFYEGPNDMHTVGRNASKTKPAKFVVVLVKKQGVDAVLPAEYSLALTLGESRSGHVRDSRPSILRRDSPSRAAMPPGFRPRSCGTDASDGPGQLGHTPPRWCSGVCSSSSMSPCARSTSPDDVFVRRLA